MAVPWEITLGISAMQSLRDVDDALQLVLDLV